MTDHINDPRISALFDDEDPVLEPNSDFMSQYTPPSEVLEDEPEIVEPRRHLTQSEGYKVYKKSDGKCFFCDRDKTNIWYNPTIAEVKLQGIHGQMEAFHVCNKCLARCVRRPLPFDDLRNYIDLLEARGSKRGRVSYQSSASETIKTAHMMIHCSIAADEAMRRDFVIIDSAQGILDVRAAEIVNGKVTLFVGKTS